MRSHDLPTVTRTPIQPARRKAFSAIELLITAVMIMVILVLIFPAKSIVP